ncbi:ABC transporter permease subunit [Paenibacillus anaericanus]|uniref:ABC transporter permease subunit n=1 Tax=Paenibacillus anaericanus TaxID=170367 RepID=A0A3S1EEE4_9BACL|nr:ABC transporter permease subunit [Paenibacillus anaericanus]RUT43857.1 ABC transporter permease subunit [Paenibacillus anaericanus]
MKKKRGRRALILLGLLPFALLIIGFLLVPVFSMLTGSFMNDSGDGFSLDQYVTALTNAFYFKAIQNSVLIALFSSLAGIIIGALAAYSITLFSPAVRNRILLMSNMTSNFAGIPLAFAYIILLGNNGIFTLLFHEWGWDIFAGFNLYSWTGLTLVYVYFQIPLAILLVYPSFYGIREQWREASYLLGASPVKFWITIGLPCIAPALLGTLGILFANAMGAYATAYALVGSNYNLLAVRISSLVTGDVVTRPQLGSALAVLLAATSIAAVWINSMMTRKVAAFTSGPSESPQSPRTRLFQTRKKVSTDQKSLTGRESA